MRRSRPRPTASSTRFRARVWVWPLVIFLTATPLAPARALSNNLIIADHDLLDSDSMSAARVQQFLANRGGFLSRYELDFEGTRHRASDVIVTVARRYGLNPKFFLTLLEKEQSLISDAAPTQHQLDYALGYGCPSSCSPAYRGFGTQLSAAARRITEDYLPALRQRGQFNGWGPGITKTTIDGIAVTPANLATAVLYVYNPYVGKYGGGDQRWGANSLFQLLWIRWFTRKYPDGALLRVRGDKGIWLIRHGQRLPFTSRSAFVANYDPAKVITVERDEIDTYDVGPAIKYPEPSLLQVTPGGGVYLLVNGERRPIASREVLRSLGYNPEEIIRGVKERELAAYPKGQAVTEADVYPTGRLLKSRTSGGVVFVDAQGFRHPIYAREIFRSQFHGQVAQLAHDQAITALPAGDPIKFRDGELVASRTERKVYFISNGTRRLVPDVETFRELGLKSKNIVWTNDRALSLHPLGEPLSDVATNGG
ncbi:MAG: hypothetical protein HY421_02440 [Candidatus Kerfeldbacteria bacterium]|nr:hypothetical protein [Candidatus Kerfeldbacteria bacterium]